MAVFGECNAECNGELAGALEPPLGSREIGELAQNVYIRSDTVANKHTPGLHCHDQLLESHEIYACLLDYMDSMLAAAVRYVLLVPGWIENF